MIEKKKIIKEIRGWSFSILGAFFIVVLLNNKVFAKVKVEQRSMENTLYSGQQLIIDKLTYNFTEAKRGDIIIFLKYGEKGTLVDEAVMVANNIKSLFEEVDKDERLVKRVIGIPGDEVDIREGYVYVNGEKLNESYTKGETFSAEIKFPISVPDNKLFVLGDNRPVSEDSRAFGLINYNQVEGKVAFRVFPLNKIGTIK